MFRASKQKDEISSKILEKFSRLIDKIKKHLADSKGSSKRDKPFTFDKINKIVFSNSGTITKRTLPASTIKMNSKSGDDGSQNLCVGLPGQTNYLVSIFKMIVNDCDLDPKELFCMKLIRTPCNC